MRLRIWEETQVIEFLDSISAIIFLVMAGVLVFLTALYALDLAWNAIRASLDDKHGWSYYFSDEGPEN